MKRAILALAAATLVAANGCGWQMQNMHGNQCGGAAGCASCGIGNGQLANRIRAGAQMGPPHVQGDFLTGLRAAHASKHDQGPAAGGGASPTVTYPYYTVRGPRDFFMNDPRPLGY